VSINPANGVVLRQYEALSDQDLNHKVATATEAFASWRKTAYAERGAILRRCADILEHESAVWGETISLEMGKPITQAIAEARKCAYGCRYFAQNAETLLRDQPTPTDASKSYVHYEPLGIVLAIMPWNFPFWQVFRAAAPALMAGNAVLLKHASNVPQCALAAEEILRRAGLPQGIFQALLIGSERIRGLIEDPRVRAVTLTGSTGAGISVGAAAGGQIKKVVLELGGSDPFIVMPSADMMDAVRIAVEARLQNGGQSCICGKRFIIHEKVYDAFQKAFVARMAALRVGDPLDRQTEVGPMATAAIREELHRQVQETVAAGARLLLGGRPLGGPGNYYAPTVLADVPTSSPAFREETFGPVAPLFRVAGAEEAIAMANDSEYGLGASVWTRDAAEQQRFIDGLDCGMVFFNGLVKSDPRIPFGGIKRSGVGRELSQHGIQEFVNIKTVWIA